MLIPALTPALTLLALVAAPQVVYIPVDKNDPNDTFAFDWEGKDVSGKPIELEIAEFILRPRPEPSPPPTPIRLPTSGMIKVGTNEYLVRQVLATVPLGRYQLNVRAKGLNGLFSNEGNDVFIEILSKNPAALLRLRHVAKP